MKSRQPSDIDYSPITPEKVTRWLIALEKGHAWPGFLKQLTNSHRKLYENAHQTEPGQIPLF